MVMENEVAKIGDLGIAKLLNRSLAAKTQIGTPHYMPPEIWKNRPYSFTSDSWAMGCILYEMCTLKVPFEARSLQELRNKVLAGRYPALPPQYSREMQQTIAACLDQNPDRRPSMDQILNSSAVLSRLDLLPMEGGVGGLMGQRGGLLDTIKVPKNLQQLKGKLPPAQYRKEAFGQLEEENEEDEASFDVGMQPMNAAMLPQIAQKAGYSQPAFPPPSQQQQQRGGYEMPAMQQQQQQRQAAPQRAMGGGGGLAADAVRAGRAALESQAQYNSPPPKPKPSLMVNVNPDQGYEWRPPQPPHPPQPSQPPSGYPQRRNQESRSSAAYGAFYHQPAPPAAGGSRQPPQQSAAALHAQRALEAARQALASHMAQQEQRGGYRGGQLNPIGVNQSPGKGGRLQSAARGRDGKPPPWNFGGAASKAVGGDGFKGSVAPTPSYAGPPQPKRYPPNEWSSPKR